MMSRMQRRKPWYKKPAGICGIAAAVLVIVGLVLFFALRDSGSKDPDVSDDPSVEVPDGKQDDIPADVPIDEEPPEQIDPNPEPGAESVIKAGSNHGSFTAAGSLTEGQKQAIFDYMDSYYSSLAGLAVKEVGNPFYGSDIASREKGAWNTIIDVRKSALEDLSASNYSFTLRVTGVNTSDGTAHVALIEDNTQQFRALSVLTEQFNVAHDFWLKRDGSLWKVSDHKCNNGLFYSYKHDSSAGRDGRYSTIMSYITRRHSQFDAQGNSPAVTCDNTYDRTAAYNYMMKWVGARNSSWTKFDDWGGNCQNFASQVLTAGGIPMNSRWYWKSAGDVTSSWINVGGFTDYAASASATEMVCDANANYYDGDVGDVLLIGIENARSHATVISAVVKDDAGRTVDYLLCSNTNDLRNFPAGAYHSSNQRLFRIFGWNNG